MRAADAATALERLRARVVEQMRREVWDALCDGAPKAERNAAQALREQ